MTHDDNCGESEEEKDGETCTPLVVRKKGSMVPSDKILLYLHLHTPEENKHTK